MSTVYFRLTSFEWLAGVPIRYDRDPEAPYGTLGRRFRFFAQEPFVDKLHSCFADLWRISGLGPAHTITSAGAFTRKPGQHGRGLAIDIDAVHWEGSSLVALRDGFEGHDRALYFAVECVLRLHFGQVLNCDYDVAHRDHFHVDDSQPVGFRTASRALTLFVQGVMRDLYAQAVPLDGVYGGDTADATNVVLRQLGLAEGFATTKSWRSFLVATALRGFKHSAVRRNRSAQTT